MSVEQNGQANAASRETSGETRRVTLTVHAGGVAVATLNRPEVLNAVDGPMRADLARVLEQVGSDDSIRALILTDRKSTRLNSSHSQISYAVFCLKKKTEDIDLAAASISLIQPSMLTWSIIADVN